METHGAHNSPSPPRTGRFRDTRSEFDRTCWEGMSPATDGAQFVPYARCEPCGASEAEQQVLTIAEWRLVVRSTRTPTPKPLLSNAPRIVAMRRTTNSGREGAPFRRQEMNCSIVSRRAGPSRIVRTNVWQTASGILLQFDGRIAHARGDPAWDSP
jgi:hypothetical protein